MRPPNERCEIEKEVERYRSLPWYDFCGQASPDRLYGCCLRRGHDGDAHVSFSASRRLIFARWTSDGRVQP